MQHTANSFNLWPIFWSIMFLMALMLIQNALPLSEALHEQAEVGVALFAFGLMHMFGGALIEKLRARPPDSPHNSR